MNSKTSEPGCGRLRAGLVGAIAAVVALGVTIVMVEGDWERAAIERGYGEACWPDGRFAWKGEC